MMAIRAIVNKEDMRMISSFTKCSKDILLFDLFIGIVFCFKNNSQKV